VKRHQLFYDQVYVLEKLVSIGLPDRNGFGSFLYFDDDRIVLDDVDATCIYNEGTVHPREFVTGQLGFNRFHGEMYGELLVERVEDHIIFKSFYPKDVFIFQPHQGRVLFYEDLVILGVDLGFKAHVGFVDGFEEAAVGNGFEQVIGYIIIESFEGIFIFRRNDNDLGRIGERFEEVDAAHFRHFNIEKNQINILIPVKGINGIHGILIGSKESKLIGAGNELFDNPSGHQVVINNNAIHRGSISSSNRKTLSKITSNI
jgi:hypothetical protein